MSHNSMALAYAMKKKKMAMGGHVEEKAEEVEEHAEAPMKHTDMYSAAKHRSHEAMGKRERAMAMFNGGEARAHKEDDLDLNQHGEEEMGPDGPFVDAEDSHHMDEHPVENQSEGEEEDMVGSIMKQKQKMFAKGGMADGKHMCSGGDCSHPSHAQHYSEGGKVANEDLPIVDDMPAEYDDLHLRDDLHDSYTGANSGDETGDEKLDHDDEDVISQIMNSRRKKDRMPRPA